MSESEAKPHPRSEFADAQVRAASRKQTRRSFTVAAIAAAAGYGLYRWIESNPKIGMQPAALRRAIEANAAVSRALFNERALAPTYPVNLAEHLRINGLIGLKQAILPESWRLQVVGVANDTSFPQYDSDVTAWKYAYSRGSESSEGDHFTFIPPEPVIDPIDPVVTSSRDPSHRYAEAGPSKSSASAATPGLLLTISDITKLPAHELVTEFKCVEGWSQVVQWAGVRMLDFLEAYPPAKKPDGTLPRYVYMETPNGDYYVGYDMAVCRHPQTLLVTHMAGQPLTQLHGAPLRLHTPTKYGYKQIKRIGLIAYTDIKPDDYWTKLGYDWYAGL